MKSSIEQQAVEKAVVETNFNICVEATAGSGKTTTALRCLTLLPKFKRTIFLSFSNTIVSELKEKVPLGVTASTLHSLGFRSIIKSHKVKVEENKYFKKCLFTFFADKKEKEKEDYKDCYRTQDICSYARMTLTPFIKSPLIDMCNYYGIDYTEESLNYAVELLNTPEKYLREVDFTDMLYLPITMPGLIKDKFDYVFLDEAQDLNECQSKFIQMILAKNGRLFAFGDSYQSIYSFAGSSIDSFQKLQQKENTITLPLSVTYRCSKDIAIEAQRVCHSIKPFEGNEKGIVRNGEIYEIVSGDMVLGRTTKSLISLYFILLKDGKKAKIWGKDIEKGLVELAKKTKGYTFDMVKNNFKKELEKCIEELKKLGIKNYSYHPKFESLTEKVQVLEVILDNTTDPYLLPEKVSEIFKESEEGISLMTLHRSKGLERDRVFMITKYNGKSTLPHSRAIQPWELVQERNLEFVGLTRAKRELVFLNLEDE